MAIRRFYCSLAAATGGFQVVCNLKQSIKMVAHDYPYAIPLVGACLLVHLFYTYLTYGGPTLGRINATLKARKHLQHVAPTFADLRATAERRHRVATSNALEEMGVHIEKAMAAYTNFIGMAEGDL